MSSSSRIALLLATLTAITTMVFLSLLNTLSEYELFMAFILAFVSSYIFSNALVFREIYKIDLALKRIKKKQFSKIKGNITKQPFNPLQKLRQDLFSYAPKNQDEIEELKKREIFIKEFLADISHELKTPIFAAQGFVYTLLDGAIDDENVSRRFLKKAGKSLDALVGLVEDLLTLSQMEHGQITMSMEDVNMLMITREVIDQLEEKAARKNIRIEVDPSDAKGLYVQADYDKIYRVMQNLISNAIKYTREDGKVFVSFQEGRKKIKITVKDNGRGIPSEDLGRIFERFYRVEKSRSKEKGGSGLGLAIVKQIVEAHHTKIKVVSSVDQGSEFSFKLTKSIEATPEQITEHSEVA